MREQSFSHYERMVIDEVALHVVIPSPVKQALRVTGWPYERIIDALGGAGSRRVQALTRRITESITDGRVRRTPPSPPFRTNGTMYFVTY